jgi:hypothetical protein
LSGVPSATGYTPADKGTTTFFSEKPAMRLLIVSTHCCPNAASPSRYDTLTLIGAVHQHSSKHTPHLVSVNTRQILMFPSHAPQRNHGADGLHWHGDQHDFTYRPISKVPGRQPQRQPRQQRQPRPQLAPRQMRLHHGLPRCQRPLLARSSFPELTPRTSSD